MRTITISLTDDDYARLEALGEARSTPRDRFTPERCLRDFARHCRPGGSGWKPPDEAARAHRRPQKLRVVTDPQDPRYREHRGHPIAVEEVED